MAARKGKKRVSLKKLHNDLHKVHQGLKGIKAATPAQRRKLNLLVRSLASSKNAVRALCPTRTFGPAAR